MKRIIFKLQFITPAFIAGAVPKNSNNLTATAELRGSSIRGQLRWWHRLLGYDTESENRIYGTIAGASGQASRVVVRILSAPSPVQAPETAKDMGLDPGQTVEYLVFNLRKDADKRSSIPAGTSFFVLLQTRNLAPEDEEKLLHTMEAFSWLGSLGTRSRRCFGSLTLLRKDGNLCPRPDDWSLFLKNPNVEVHSTSVNAPDWRELVRRAGRWLRDKRAAFPKEKKRTAFGSADPKSRQASRILLRPDWVGGRFNLIAIGPTEILREVGLSSRV
jgi:CRISPR type III-B/RAMP module RAMP protein Cmr1